MSCPNLLASILPDLAWLSEEWSAIQAAGAAGRTVTLSSTPTWGSGGIRVRLADNSAQLDNRFEGRLARYEASIQRAILQKLFPTDPNASARSGGPQ